MFGAEHPAAAASPPLQHWARPGQPHLQQQHHQQRRQQQHPAVVLLDAALATSDSALVPTTPDVAMAHGVASADEEATGRAQGQGQGQQHEEEADRQQQQHLQPAPRGGGQRASIDGLQNLPPDMAAGMEDYHSDDGFGAPYLSDRANVQVSAGAGAGTCPGVAQCGVVGAARVVWR